MPSRALRATLALLSLAVAVPGAATPTVPAAREHVEAVAVPSAEAIRLDGDLNDAVWQRARPVTDFRQRDPKEGADPTFRTEVRVAYDATAIYVAVDAFDTDPSRIVGLLTRRDSESPSDWIQIFIDSYYDHRTAYEFGVNPAGVKTDAYWYNDDDQDSSWDAVWDVAVSKNARGWRAEFRIPFSQLRFRRGGAGTMGFGVARKIGRLNETSTWPLVAKSVTGLVSQFGDLTGVTLSGSPKRLELVPYGVTQVATSPDAGENPLVTSPDPGASMGLDLKYAVTPGLTLTGTVNPDFGQVEADPAVVNLSAFETFFAERRPFFVEGSGIFRFDIDCNDGVCSGLFYSRRIGRAPQGELDVPDDGYTAMPAQTTILGAAKLTGRMGPFSIGVLNALTAEETGSAAVGDVRTQSVVEPLTNYAVVRARREFANQSSLGFMLTSTNRALTANLGPTLAKDAVTGGVDWDWRIRKNYSLSGNWAGSTVRGSAEAIAELQQDNTHSFQRPDATHLEFDPTRTAIDGDSGLLSFSKIGGESVRFNTNVAFKSPGFDINDLGFMRRADQRTQSNWLQWRHERPTKYFRSFRINFNQWAGWNFGGDRLFIGGNINAHAVFTNNWSTGFGFNVEGTNFNDRLTRGGPGGFEPGYRTQWGYVSTDDRRRVAGNLFLGHGTDGHGSWFGDLNPETTIRPTSALSVSLGVRYSRNVNDSQWIEEVDDGGPRYVFGHLNQTTVGLTTRVNYTMSPTLSLQIYAEPFVSAGAYTHFKELVDGRASVYADRYAPYAYSGNPDFNYKSFRTTNVLRWEYRPGSTLFVVWQQNREDSAEYGQFRFAHDFGHVFSAPAQNVFLVKLAYWLNY
jgi:hypothetical protein